MLTVQTAHPHPRLRPFLRSYVLRESQSGTPEMVEPVVARLQAILEFQFADPYDVPIYGIEQPNPSHPVTVIGPITSRRARIVIRGHVQALAVLFQPFGFHALFGVPQSPLANVGYEAQGVLGPAVSALHERLGNTPELPRRAALLDQFFLGCLHRVRPSENLRGALGLLLAPGPSVTIGQVARHAGFSPRQLERSALNLAGMSPQKIGRIARFQRALRLKTQTSATWTEIAHSANYFDQMHMIRDFRAFASNTPGQTLKHVSPYHLNSVNTSSLRPTRSVPPVR